LPLLRYSCMINGIAWLVATKLDVLDELAEIPVCIGYKVDGKETSEIPSQSGGYERIECIYKNLPGWKQSTEGITELDKLPKAAREYMNFVERETGARIGMISTGPGREETIVMEDFLDQLKSVNQSRSRAEKV